MSNLKVLAISYGRQLFDTDNAERKRMEMCAETVSEYHMIVFSRRGDGLKPITTPTGLYLHPTNSKNKLMMVYDAYRIGKSILKTQKGQWVITSQDPFEAGLVGYILSHRYSTPLNIQEHGDFFSTPYWKRDTKLNRVRFLIGKWLLKKATTVRVVSERIKKTVVSMGVSSERILLLPVRSDQIRTQTQQVYDYGFGADKTVILTMARLEKQKNLPILLRAFASVNKDHPNSRLVIIGRGTQEVNLKQLTEQLGLLEVVTFLDWTNEPEKHFNAADIYALTSDWEGWARVLVEAMAYGLPIVTTDVGCAGEVIINEKHGFVVPVRDEKAFTSKLNQLVTDKSLRDRFSTQALTDYKAVQNVSLENYAASWSAVLEKTVASF